MATESNILKESIRKCASKLTIVVFFSFFINILMFVAPLHMLQMYDRVLVSRSEVTLLVLTALAVGLLMIYGILEAVRTRILTRIGLQFDELMSGRMLNMVFDIAVRRPSVGAPQQIIRDADSLRDFISGPAITALCDAPWVPVFIGACFILHPMLGSIALAGAILVFALAASNELLTKKILSEANKLWLKAVNDSVISLRNSEIVKALGMISAIKMGWTRNRDNALVYQSSANDRAGTIMALSRFVRMGLQVVILAAGAYLAIQNQITPGTMIAASIIMGRALAPVEMAVGQWKNFISVRNAYNRINDLVEGHPDDPEVMDLPAPTGKISLQGVFVAAPEQSTAILTNITINFAPGTITGIVGPSGCGKSSLARVLVGVWPALRGAVRYDGADIRNWSSEKLGPHIGYMPQDVELFDGTVAQNICRFQNVEADEIVAAATQAGVHELILQLPGGYDTNIGPGGQALSGGQRQRIALARALYKGPQVIVLDEPNSNLDAAGEKALTDAIIRAKKSGATVIVVSHRPSLLSSTDNIMVMNKGAVLKVGSRDSVLSELASGKPITSNTPAPANN
jgi:PrtD family type I secretion system ABC transporter